MTNSFACKTRGCTGFIHIARGLCNICYERERREKQKAMSVYIEPRRRHIVLLDIIAHTPGVKVSELSKRTGMQQFTVLQVLPRLKNICEDDYGRLFLIEHAPTAQL